MFRWLHKYIRRRSKPIPEDVAVLWKRRLSIAYGILAWNAFGLLVYSIYQGKADWPHYYGLKSDEEHAMPPGTYFLFRFTLLFINFCIILYFLQLEPGQIH